MSSNTTTQLPLLWLLRLNITGNEEMANAINELQEARQKGKNMLKVQKRMEKRYGLIQGAI